MLKFYHAPWSRSSAILWLLEELGVEYEMELVDIRAEGGVPEDYRRIQPNKKVPAIDHDGTILTERAAIAIYLGDAFPEAGLAPAIGDSARAAYLTALVYHDSVFDPVVCARAYGLSYGSNDYPFGLFEDMLRHMERRLGGSLFVTGSYFTIADVIFGTGINYTMNILKALPERAVFQDYVARVTERPAYKRSSEKDAALAARVPAFKHLFEEQVR